jgi:conjugal transfer mating pair stabilization protein TraG
MWTIHSVGDSAFLEQVLIAVSMITGTGDFTQMASVGLLIGVLIVFFQSIMNGAKEIQIGTILVAWIFYASSHP